jgi:hypothetical protein
MTILSGNVIAVGLITVSLLLPMHIGFSVALFILGCLIWLTCLGIERERKLIDLELTRTEQRRKRFRMGRTI